VEIRLKADVFVRAVAANSSKPINANLAGIRAVSATSAGIVTVAVIVSGVVIKSVLLNGVAARTVNAVAKAVMTADVEEIVTADVDVIATEIAIVTSKVADLSQWMRQQVLLRCQKIRIRKHAI
jgi:hypothetical protein